MGKVSSLVCPLCLLFAVHVHVGLSSCRFFSFFSRVSYPVSVHRFARPANREARGSILEVHFFAALLPATFWSFTRVLSSPPPSLQSTLLLSHSFAFGHPPLPVLSWPCLKEEEWRRHLPPLLGEFSSLSPAYPSIGGGGGCVSSVVCSSSSSTSIFDVAGGGGGGGPSSGCIFDLSRFGGGGGGYSNGGTAASGYDGGGGADGKTCDAGSGRHFFCNGSTVEGSDGHDADGGGSPKTAAAAAGGGAACSGGALSRGVEGAAAGGRQPQGKGKESATTPAAWPPGGLGEGEGLRINDLPDVSHWRAIVSSSQQRTAPVCCFLSSTVYYMLRFRQHLYPILRYWSCLRRRLPPRIVS